jgi:hypothetical protein
VSAAIDHVVAGGPALGSPHVEKIQRTNLHKLKEVRVDRRIRLLFAFESNRDAVMLVGGDKTRAVEPLVSGEHQACRAPLR